MLADGEVVCGGGLHAGRDACMLADGAVVCGGGLLSASVAILCQSCCGQSRAVAGWPLGREWCQTLRLCVPVAELQPLLKAIEFQEWGCTA